MKKVFNGKKRGFTLFETIIVLAITSVLAIGAMQVLSMAIKIQSFTLTNQTMMDQASFIIEAISRDVRLASKDYKDECGIKDASGKPRNYIVAPAGDSIKFLTQRGKCVEYKIIGGDEPQVRVWKATTTAISAQTGKGEGVFGPLIYDLPLNSSDFKVKSLQFYVWGDTDATGESATQPRITIFLYVESKYQKEANLRLQTTVSLRNENK